MTIQPVRYLTIDSNYAGQRIDNFLFRELKGIPKSHIYKLLRKGEIRVNKKRTKPEYKLNLDDIVRIAPLKQADEVTKSIPAKGLFSLLQSRILYEDEDLLIINKPAGLAVHAGSGIETGIIDVLRYHLKYEFLELAHRLDRETSGCLILAKKPVALRQLHTLMRQGQINKIYLALVQGHWPPGATHIDAPLLKNQLRSGERMVEVDETGKSSHTEFNTLEQFPEASLVAIKLHTGRTHQIRVHATYSGHPLAGDDKYGDKDFNRNLKKYGLKRLFLHASELTFKLEPTSKLISVVSALDEELAFVLRRLRE